MIYKQSLALIVANKYDLNGGISCDGRDHLSCQLLKIWWIIQIYLGSLTSRQSGKTATKSK